MFPATWPPPKKVMRTAIQVLQAGSSRFQLDPSISQIRPPRPGSHAPQVGWVKPTGIPGDPALGWLKFTNLEATTGVAHTVVESLDRARLQYRRTRARTRPLSPGSQAEAPFGLPGLSATIRAMLWQPAPG